MQSINKMLFLNQEWLWQLQMLLNKGFYVNKISRGNDTDDVDYLVVSVNPPKDVKPVDHNTN